MGIINLYLFFYIMNKRYKIILSVIFCFISNNLYGKTKHINHQADDHAPIGVMRDHIHNKGEFMLSYRINYMQMKELKNGDDKVTTQTALQNYNMVPNEMTMKMHMVGAMYGFNDKLTFASMLGFIEKNMQNIKKDNSLTKNKVNGISDLKLNALYKFYQRDKKRVQFNLGISLPTGSIDNKNSQGKRLAYAMQIGSGSYELLPGIHYSNKINCFSYGGQINLNFRLNHNKYAYKLGDHYNITAWLAKKLNNNISISSRLDYNKNEDIEGKDSSLMINMMPTANNALQARESLDLLLGTNLLFSESYLENHRLAFEIALPLYQKIAGPNLANDYKLTIGWQKVF